MDEVSKLWIQRVCLKRIGISLKTSLTIVLQGQKTGKQVAHLLQDFILAGPMLRSKVWDCDSHLCKTVICKRLSESKDGRMIETNYIFSCCDELCTLVHFARSIFGWSWERFLEKTWIERRELYILGHFTRNYLGWRWRSSQDGIEWNKVFKDSLEPKLLGVELKLGCKLSYKGELWFSLKLNIFNNKKHLYKHMLVFCV